MGCIYAKPNGGKPCFSWPWRRAAARNDLNSSARHIESMTVDEDKDGDVDAESGDEPTPLFSAADIDAGVPRLSRLSGQYLPPSGSRLATVPKYNFELRYSYLSQRGYYPEALDKANQDSFCIHTQFGRDPNDHFFGVFDGHGEYGTQCSQFVKKHLCENLLKDKHFMTDMEQAYHSAFIATNAQLHRHTIDDSMSGTTAITVLVRGKTLYVANVGDSRAVLAEKRGKDIIAMDLSSDQTPFRSDECARVKLCGARVLTLDQLEGLKNPNVQCWGGDEDDDGDPPRLWVANGMYPGTAFTRSIGDKIAEQIGVIAVPEVLVMELTPNNPFFVIASDGVFEFLTSQQVVDMVSQHTDPCNACAAVVAESYRLWLQYETRTDDITIIVVRINNLSGDTESGFGSTTLRQENNLSTNNLSPPPFRAQRQMETRPVRHEISGARRKAIESSFHGSIKEPTLELHAKSAEDVAHIEKALQGNFLFNGLTEKQRHILYDCMEKLDVKAGDIIIRQGAEDSCFYIVASGEFEVLVSQSGDGGEQDLGTVVNHYTSDNFSCFGELALMYSKPRQSSVRAVKDGSLWTLKREVFRSVLSMHYSQESRIKTLRNVDILSHLTFPQLKRLSEAMTEMSFKKGEVFVRKDDEVCSLYVVNDGVVQLTYHEGATWTERKETSKLVNGGNCFGEWALLGDTSTRITATALTDVDCWMVSKLKFETDVGSLHEIIQEDKRLGDRINMLRKKNAPQINVEDFANVNLSDLEWQNTVYSTDCCEIGFVLRKGTSSVISMKRYWKKKLKLLGREAQALQEKMLMRQLRPSLFVPQVISTCADTEYAAILLNTCVVGPLSLVLRAPLDENSARFLAASAVVAVDLLHKDGVVYRGISPDILMLDDKGNLQLVDFRFAKKITNERTFTICGIADFLAPEILKGQGHGFAADWWALGVLIYFMLQNELPFGSWRDSELDIYAKVARGQLQIPDTFSSEVTDLLRKLLVVEEGYRLGSDERGVDLIKQHPWFHGLNWDDMLDCQVHVPKELQTRLELALESYHIEETAHFPDFGETNLKDLNTSLWLEDW
ncbi:hypothetical protein KP509_16G047700 [Ceratopteris richardii]|uniref:protein-serine/threonine phosphatase n=1 Tax=Ceratopteris richardii TaxID=49495 RepID=A0A8T2SYK9_CERRI|nr:hypothetical protein KP509_16G047700 [Ceratopteris richardii]KAH7387903.1 hypothetical protein KP509_16G047700 [Ceratopteris richardii]